MSKKVRINIVGSGTIEEVGVKLATIAEGIKNGHYTNGLYNDGICIVETQDLLYKIKDISK